MLVANPCTGSSAPRAYAADSTSDIYKIKNAKKGDLIVVASPSTFQVWKMYEDYTISESDVEGVDYIAAEPCGVWVWVGSDSPSTDLYAVTNPDYEGGAVGDGVSDDSEQVEAAAAAVPEGSQIYFPEGTYLLDAVAISRDVGIKVHPKAILKHKANATSNMISYTAACTGVVEGGTWDGNKTGQVLTGAAHTRYATLQTYSDGMRVRDILFQNYTLAAINDLNTRTRIYLDRVNFKNGAEHGGELRTTGRGTEQSSAIQVTATTANINPHWYINKCHVWQDSDPSATGKAPGGFIFGGVVSTSTLITAIATYCTFKKIGQSFPRPPDPANHIGCIDFYEGCVKCQIIGCEFIENKYGAIKCSNAFGVLIDGIYADGIDAGILESEGVALIQVDTNRVLGDASTDYGHSIIANVRLFDAGNCPCIRIAGRGTASADELPDVSINGARCQNSTGRALQIVNVSGKIEVNGGVFVGAGPGASSGAVEVQNVDTNGEVHFNNAKITATANQGLYAVSGIAGSIFINGGSIKNSVGGTSALVISASKRVSLNGPTLDGTAGFAYQITGAGTLHFETLKWVAGSRSITWANVGNAEGDLEGNGEPGAAGVKSLVGTTYRRLDGGAGSVFYVKEGIAGSVADTTSWAPK